MKLSFITSIIIIAIIALVILQNYRREAFGTSPGTLVQLAASHVPTVREVHY
jgi:hypothetical protein